MLHVLLYENEGRHLDIFFSMFGVAMMAFAFMGGNMRFLDEGLAIWLIIAGAVVAGVGMIGVFAKNDFFIYDINEAS